jgi:hypothetical protein
MRPSLGRHYQQFYEWSDIRSGVHDYPLRIVEEVTEPDGERCVGHHEKAHF